MTLNQFQKDVTEWLAGLPPDEDYTAGLIVARWKADNENGNSNMVGFTGPREEYMPCIGALAENGAKHGYLAKTIPMNNNKDGNP
ncbi:MAG: hypothetical protein KGJ13_08435 [Patescibacteria group bacterium]|nr:hypothetical protein [Patescibacteria group bacterium]